MGRHWKISADEALYQAEIGRRVEDLRRRRKMRNDQLARAAGVKPTMLFQYQVGNTRWPAFRLRLLADYFRVPLEHLMPKYSLNVESPAAPQELF